MTFTRVDDVTQNDWQDLKKSPCTWSVRVLCVPHVLSPGTCHINVSSWLSVIRGLHGWPPGGHLSHFTNYLLPHSGVVPDNGPAFYPVINRVNPEQNGRRFADAFSKCIFMNENGNILIQISLKIVPKGSVNNKSALILVMAWCC